MEKSWGKKVFGNPESVRYTELGTTNQPGCTLSWIQGCKFSDFDLISDFFTLTPLTTIFEISTFEYI